MKAFVAGSQGYLGSAIVAQLQECGIDCVPLSSRRAPSTRLLDLRAVHAFEWSMIESGDVIAFAAALSSPDVCAKDPALAKSINVTGTSEFIGRALDTGARIIFFSSDTVYGERPLAFDETARTNPAGTYAEMKLAVEDAFASHPSFRSIRLSYVFSCRDKFTKYLAACAARGDVAEVFDPFLRSVVHVDDVVLGVQHLAAAWDDHPYRVINFAGPQVVSRIEFAETVKNAALPQLQIRHMEPEASFFENRPRVIRMESASFAKVLGRPARELRDAVQMEFELKETTNNG
jgi:dTDP-4-dehydrorhamnose reductase